MFTVIVSGSPGCFMAHEVTCKLFTYCIVSSLPFVIATLFEINVCTRNLSDAYLRIRLVKQYQLPQLRERLN